MQPSILQLHVWRLQLMTPYHTSRSGNSEHSLSTHARAKTASQGGQRFAIGARVSVVVDGLCTTHRGDHPDMPSCRVRSLKTDRCTMWWTWARCATQTSERSLGRIGDMVPSQRQAHYGWWPISVLNTRRKSPGNKCGNHKPWCRIFAESSLLFGSLVICP